MAAADMPSLLARLVAEVDPATTQYDSGRRATWLAGQPTPSASADQRRARVELAVELQRAGELEPALDLLTAERAAASAHGADLATDRDLRELTSLIAVTWLRLGEVENCVLSHNSASCLLPLTAEGVHSVQRGSRNASRELERLVRSDPDDLTSRWLANVAAMTLGEYPDGVPAGAAIPPGAFASEGEVGRFVDVAPAAGLDRRSLAGGGALDDFDGDSDLDVVVSSWGLADPMGVYLNGGAGHFADRSAAAGLDGITGGLNLVHADYDNDGDLDVFVPRGGWAGEQGRFPNSLLRNDGSGTFTDVTMQAGLLSFHPTQTAAFGDYDNDGYLDIYVGNETRDPAALHPAELFHNRGDGTFTDVALEAGVAVIGFIKGVVWGDYDNDGDQDLFVSRMTQPNLLLRNDESGGRRRFADVTDQAGVAEPAYSFPTWFFDYDNDGWLDLFVSGYGNPEHFLTGSAGDVAADYLGLPTAAERPRLYRNRGDGTFADVTRDAGLYRVLTTMGSNYGDLDNDGWEDIYLGTGDPDLRSIVPNRAFRNDAGRFLDVTTSAGLGHLQKGHAVSFGDVDHDGDQDIHMVVGGSYTGDWYQNAMFVNPGNANHWITLRLAGTRSNRSAIGARVRVDLRDPAGPRSIYRAVSTGGSFGGNSLQLEIGLGAALAIEQVVIDWPSGLRTEMAGLQLDAAYAIREGDTAPSLLELEVMPLGAEPQH